MWKTSFLILSLLILVITPGCGREGGDAARPPMSITDTLGGAETEGFEKVYHPKQFIFPNDHGAHPRYKNEWWYFTGNLFTANGRSFGFQFTLFRYAVSPKIPAEKSSWATNQIYLAHVALSDIENGVFHTDERFSRGAMGLAGVTNNTLHAWLDDWTLVGNTQGCNGCLAVDLSIVAKDFRLKLHILNIRPAALHGDRGFSRKSPAADNASYYYSYTRMSASGDIRVAGAVYPVHGSAWFDHEWSTSSLDSDQSGWDWFSLQLTSRVDLMVFRLRNRTDPEKDYYYGSLIRPDGGVEALHKGNIKLLPLGNWKSSTSGIEYPLTWRLDIPAKNIHMMIRPKMANQEMNQSFRYWEGAVEADGISSGIRISGVGYMELTGY